MHVHLPKPLHGWRAFVGEVGIIVLGVLIALSAEQLVDALHWRGEVTGARHSLNAQLSDSKFNALERVKLNRCLAEELDRTRQLITTVDHPPAIYVWGAPDRLWTLSAWDSAVASGALEHMGRSERDLYASLNTYNLKLSQWNAQEFEVEGEVRSLSHPRMLSAPERDHLIDDVSRLQSLNSIMTEAAEQWLDLAKPLHLAVEPDETVYLHKHLPCPRPEESPRISH